MDNEMPAVSLRSYVAQMLVLETELEDALSKMPSVLNGHPEASEVVGNLRTTMKRHVENLHQRLQAIDSNPVEIATMVRENSGPRLPLRPSETIQILHGLLDQAALGYAVLHVVAHRFFDSRGEGNTADLSEGHLRDYAQAAQALNRIVSDVAVWELGNVGQECQCKCSSCGLGVCLCSPHGMNTVADVWRDASSARGDAQASGIRVRPPRIGSPAAHAGLRAGDSILLVDGREIGNESWDSISTIQDAIKKHQAGEPVRFRIRRASGTLEDVSVSPA
jgi:hypothetical protein